MTGTDLCVNKPQSVPVIFEPPCIYGGQEVHTGFQWGDVMERDRMEELGLDGRVI
jgi:hypothetical protein